MILRKVTVLDTTKANDAGITFPVLAENDEDALNSIKNDYLAVGQTNRSFHCGKAYAKI